MLLERCNIDAHDCLPAHICVLLRWHAGLVMGTGTTPADADSACVFVELSRTAQPRTACVHLTRFV
jgi:hypothetical protein